MNKKKKPSKGAVAAPDHIFPDWGDVLVTAFPFSNHGNFKRRPAVFLGYGHNPKLPHHERDKIIIAITSRLDSVIPGAYIEDWAQAGLLKPCAFKPSIMTVESDFIVQKAGKLTARDKRKLKRLLKFWILEE
jgi:hypothetical protein